MNMKYSYVNYILGAVPIHALTKAELLVILLSNI